MICPVKISIIIPVYNVEAYLTQCLDTCVNQTLYDIEIICVNDGSTDSSLDILKKYAEIDPRIKIINKENGGLSSARNAGIKSAMGEWLMFLDSDDFLSLNACERVWAETQEAKTDIIAFGSDMYPQNPRPPHWYERTLYIGTRRYYSFNPDVLFKEPGAKPFIWRQAFKKEFIDSLDVLFDDGYGEDIIFQFKVFPFANNVAFISDRLYNYRWYRQGSLMESINHVPEQKMARHIDIVNIIFEYWEKHGIFEKYTLQPLEWLLSFTVYDLIENNYEKKKEYAARLREIIKRYDLTKHYAILWPEERKLYKKLMSF